MKYLLTILIISALSCKKNNDSKPKYDPAPSVVNISATVDNTGTVAHPKFNFTLNVPDTSVVKEFIIFNSTALPIVIINPKSATYTVTDTFNSYPLQASKKTYTPGFLMEDNSTIYASTFDVN